MSALRRWLTFLRLAWGEPSEVAVTSVDAHRARQRQAARSAFLQSQGTAQRFSADRQFGDVQ